VDEYIYGIPEPELDEAPLDEFLIPGDNTQNQPPQDAVLPINPDAPSNLTAIPDQPNGDIPIIHSPSLIRP